MWRNNNLDDVRKSLLDQGVIEAAGDIDEDMAFYIREALMRLTGKGSPPVKILITSNGGSVRYGLDIFDFLKIYTGETQGIVAGMAESMAAIILQACKKRKITRHATMLIHHVSTTQVKLDVLRNKNKTAKALECLERDQARLYQILSDSTGHTIKEIRSACAKEKRMSAEEALSFRLVDEIVF